MPFQIGIEHILIFCIFQTILIIVILFQKKYHQLPNLFLGVTFGMLLSIYSLYLLEHLGLFDNLNALKSLKRAVEQFPPPIIYMYMGLLVSGKSKSISVNKSYLFIPFLAALLAFLLILIQYFSIISEARSNQLLLLFMIVFSLSAGIGFLTFGYKLIQLIRSKMRNQNTFIQCILFLKEKRYRWVRLMGIIFFIHGTIFLVEFIYLIIVPHNRSPFLINTAFYITLGYVFLIYLIQNPTIIHFSNKTAGSLVLKKYEKSGLSEEEAKGIMQKMNDYMEKDKPFIESQLSLQDLSQKLGVPVHTISEVTNGLMGQNFFDYVNNYRIEEFKILALLPENKDVKILHLAFEVGFSSKTSFNIAFKKFSGETPSQFIKSIN